MDNANAVAAEVAGSGYGSGSLDEANDLVVSGGDVDTADAAAIQQISEYNETASDYEITDNAAAVISAGDSVIEDGGVTRVEVTGDATASEGVDLNAYSANVDFNVSDTVLAFGNALTTTALTTTMNQGHGFVTNLDDANVVTVTSGTADVQLAEDIQGISGYDAISSNYDIEDTPAAHI